MVIWLDSQQVAQDVKGSGDIVGGDGLVDAVVADGSQQRAGNLAVTALLVVAHQGQQLIIVVTGRLKERLGRVGVGIKNESQGSDLSNWVDMFLFTELKILRRGSLLGDNC